MQMSCRRSAASICLAVVTYKAQALRVDEDAADSDARVGAVPPGGVFGADGAPFQALHVPVPGMPGATAVPLSQYNIGGGGGGVVQDLEAKPIASPPLPGGQALPTVPLQLQPPLAAATSSSVGGAAASPRRLSSFQDEALTGPPSEPAVFPSLEKLSSGRRLSSFQGEALAGLPSEPNAPLPSFGLPPVALPPVAPQAQPRLQPFSEASATPVRSMPEPPAPTVTPVRRPVPVPEPLPVEVVATPPPSYDCHVDLSSWKVSWSQSKKDYCCRTQHVGCEEQDGHTFDCHAGLRNFEIGWSAEKKAWCCKTQGLGCGPGRKDEIEVTERADKNALESKRDLVTAELDEKKKSDADDLKQFASGSQDLLSGLTARAKQVAEGLVASAAAMANESDSEHLRLAVEKNALDVVEQGELSKADEAESLAARRAADKKALADGKIDAAASGKKQEIEKALDAREAAEDEIYKQNMSGVLMDIANRSSEVATQKQNQLLLAREKTAAKNANADAAASRERDAEEEQALIAKMRTMKNANEAAAGMESQNEKNVESLLQAADAREAAMEAQKDRTSALLDSSSDAAKKQAAQSYAKAEASVDGAVQSRLSAINEADAVDQAAIEAAHAKAVAHGEELKAISMQSIEMRRQLAEKKAKALFAEAIKSAEVQEMGMKMQAEAKAEKERREANKKIDAKYLAEEIEILKKHQKIQQDLRTEVAEMILKQSTLEQKAQAAALAGEKKADIQELAAKEKAQAETNKAIAAVDAATSEAIRADQQTIAGAQAGVLGQAAKKSQEVLQREAADSDNVEKQVAAASKQMDADEARALAQVDKDAAAREAQADGALGAALGSGKRNSEAVQDVAKKSDMVDSLRRQAAQQADGSELKALEYADKVGLLNVRAVEKEADMTQSALVAKKLKDAKSATIRAASQSIGVIKSVIQQGVANVAAQTKEREVAMSMNQHLHFAAADKRLRADAAVMKQQSAAEIKAEDLRAAKLAAKERQNEAQRATQTQRDAAKLTAGQPDRAAKMAEAAQAWKEAHREAAKATEMQLAAEQRTKAVARNMGATPHADSVLEGASGEVVGDAGAGAQAFDCAMEKDFKTAWSVQKLNWCCQFQGVGCGGGSGVQSPSSLSEYEPHKRQSPLHQDHVFVPDPKADPYGADLTRASPPPDGFIRSYAVRGPTNPMPPSIQVMRPHDLAAEPKGDKPTKPGCYVYLPSGCHLQNLKYDYWARDVQCEKEGQYPPVTKEDCMAQELHYNSWCLVADTRMLYVPFPEPGETTTTTSGCPSWAEK
eukprot:TRINITY_DN21610_c0_g1_i1.p1 TRINITY_DN21610_c0_g1~~TRINITY_DN21610_c0_g1_i1.p1  ORF type:complete len:1289 (-),score=474.10 TRINITY_DN21610_c0_g1_i1:127-3993(-)